MRLSELIQFLNYLDQQDLSDCYSRSINPFGNIASMINNSSVLDRSEKDPVNSSMQHVDQSLQDFSKSVRDLRHKIMRRVAEMESSYFAASTELFRNDMRNDSVQHITNRVMSLTDQAAAIFEQRLKIYTSWQHPGLIFRPIHLTAFHDIVALDPMYLADTHPALLISPTQQFTDRYQRRVRNYIIDDHAGGAILDQLPREQFGLVAAQNFLNFKPIEIVNQYVTEVFELLKPGGAFVFTYNNCDYAGPVKLTENHFTCYTPGRLIRQTAAQAGYIVNYEYNEINGASIMELLKPGHRPSLRGGQTLAVIKDNLQEFADKPVKKNKKQKTPKNIDIPVTRYYTDEERQRIQLSAVIMGIDTEENILGNYAIEKLEQLVTDRLNTPEFSNDKFQKRLEKLILKRKQQ